MKIWSSTEIEQLKVLYVENDIPSDSLIKDKVKLSKFTIKLNSRLSKTEVFDEKDVADQLLRLRKNAKLPRIRH